MKCQSWKALKMDLDYQIGRVSGVLFHILGGEPGLLFKNA